MRILFLEDDPIIADIVREYLISQNYIIDYAYDIEEAENYLDKYIYDLYLLDVNVPDGNSFELLRSLRSFNNKTPAIFITALNDTNDMKKGFDSGCDDYIKKPFELEELNLRINNIKRIYNLDDKTIIDTNITIDSSSNTIKINDTIKNISKKEAKILQYLSSNHNRTVSNEEISQNLWEYDNMPSNATVRTYIKNLRNILGVERIKTIKGVGYRFIKS